MTVSIPLDRQILALTDDQLEKFVREWISHKKEYVEVERLTGPGDMGRDVVGYLTNNRSEGSWHNFQCKQYGRTLSTAKALEELAKVLYYASEGHFTAPAGFYFVAPRGVNRNLRGLISNPSRMKKELTEDWNEHAADKIVDGKTLHMSDKLRAFISAWDFSRVHSLAVDDLLADAAAKPVLQQWFGVDPGPAPVGEVPDEIEDQELPYVGALLGAYGEREGSVVDRVGIKEHPVHGEHFSRQRERFFDADSFSRFYRDNTMHEEIDMLRRDMRHGIAEVHGAKHQDSLARADAVMSQAAIVQPSGTLARYARVPVKQGICHHFVNEGSLEWRQS
jgi:hypothetical protein